MEIGSIYEICPDALRKLQGAPDENGGKEPSSAWKEALQYGKKYAAFTASGREAIALCLEGLWGKSPALSRKCLLPAYMCDSVFFPFERAGCELSFYPIGRSLEADREELCRLVEELRPGLLFIHDYYGMDTWKAFRPLLMEWRRRGICVMEDVTQSLYLEEAGREADYVVGSLRKWYPVPDGGFAASDRPFPKEKPAPEEACVRERLRVLTDKWRYLHGAQETAGDASLKEEYLHKNRELEKRLDGNRKIRSLSAVTERLLSAEDGKRCRERRRKNSRLLSEGLAGGRKYAPAIPCEETGAVPLYFPVYARRREELQEYLRARDIYAPVLWPVGKANEKHLTESDRYLFRHLLALPVDQRYGEKEMDRILEVMEEYDRISDGQPELADGT